MDSDSFAVDRSNKKVKESSWEGLSTLFGMPVNRGLLCVLSAMSLELDTYCNVCLKKFWIASKLYNYVFSKQLEFLKLHYFFKNKN
jgi:hypothetical protein